ncbi:hypothetical protein [Marinobacter sp. F3R08]|uniref:hypothetical protein n=1 Tax=Marinobacter sp. F3R08 TaxID=2841559 RepID=UPI001C0931C3|nr:hypothetical protein [Marinobacter sp. F3R08]MBU2952233.1 hypothetical protein [Marinobacter sp. F3R08]
MNNIRILRLFILALVLCGCSESSEDLKVLARDVITQQYDWSDAPLIEIKEIGLVVPTTKPPREFLNERSDVWEYLAVNAQVVLKEPTYHIVNRRLLSPMDNRYKLILKQATPSDYEGVLVGKIRKIGSYVSGFYAHSIHGDQSLKVGKFLSSLNPSGQHEIQILDAVMFGASNNSDKTDDLDELQSKLKTAHGLDVKVDRI